MPLGSLVGRRSQEVKGRSRGQLGYSISQQSRWIVKDQVCRTGGDRMEIFGSTNFVLLIAAREEPKRS